MIPAPKPVRNSPGAKRMMLEVDVANNKVTFKGPKGNAKVVNVQDPEMQAKLPSLKPGQVVQFTYTEAIAVAIQPKK